MSEKKLLVKLENNFIKMKLNSLSYSWDSLKAKLREKITAFKNYIKKTRDLLSIN